MVQFKDPFEKLEKESANREKLRKPLIAGNWKMNKVIAEALEYALELKKRVTQVSDVEILICAPFPFLAALVRTFQDSVVKVGAQNLYWEKSGAFTGEVSAEMLESVGCSYVIIGHSERRHLFGETSEQVNKKVFAALGAFLNPIVCIGETLEEREAMKTDEVLKTQITQSLAGLTPEQMLKCVVAYEPVWAINTGVNATPEQAQEMHKFIRSKISEKYGNSIADSTTILYGGSCNAANAKGLFENPDVDEGLIGGASLKAQDFFTIITSF